MPKVKAGMLKGKVEEVHGYAGTLAAELDREDDSEGGPPL